MTASARRATSADLGVLGPLVQASHAQRRLERGGRELEAIDPRPEIDEAILDDRRTAVFVGEFEGVVFGYAHAQIRMFTAASTPIATLWDLYVEFGARGVGIGEALFDAVMDWARLERCAGIDGVVLPGNREGKNFFERYGMVSRAIAVYRAL